MPVDLCGFIAGGRSYLTLMETNYSTNLRHSLLLSDIWHQSQQSDEWGRRVLNGLRKQQFLSDVDLDSCHPFDPPSALQPLPDLVTIKRFLGTELAAVAGDEQRTQALMGDIISIGKRAENKDFSQKHPHRLLWALAEEMTPNFTDPKGHQGLKTNDWLDLLLSAPMLTLVTPERSWHRGSAISTAFVVDFDNDTVSSMRKIDTERKGPDGPWEILSCAQLSAQEQLAHMREDLHSPDINAFCPPFWQQLGGEAQRSNLSRFNQLGGAALRSFLYSPCAANLGRPPGFPLLVDKDRYPVDDDPYLLDERYRQEVDLVPMDGAEVEETELERLTREAVEAHDLYGFTSEQLVDVARTVQPATGRRGKREITPQMYNLIIALKHTRDFPNWRISEMVGATQTLVQQLTAGMPPAKRHTRRVK